MSEDGAAYRVLARKRRPTSFAGLIGQEPLVRTPSNATATDRLAHAYPLTGVRGVGKTSTARIIARALNCIGRDGNGGPTPELCGACEHCVSIAEDRHVDVIEMDAASRTGNDDVHELIESVRYRPISARHKVSIIDEVHMLSKQAFNALLKTLEEPPPHVKFVFATTEARRLPVTVLSRCQRFDLRRVGMETPQRRPPQPPPQGRRRLPRFRHHREPYRQGAPARHPGHAGGLSRGAIAGRVAPSAQPVHPSRHDPVRQRGQRRAGIPSLPAAWMLSPALRAVLAAAIASLAAIAPLASPAPASPRTGIRTAVRGRGDTTAGPRAGATVAASGSVLRTTARGSVHATVRRRAFGPSHQRG